MSVLPEGSQFKVKKSSGVMDVVVSEEESRTVHAFVPKSATKILVIRDQSSV